MLIVAELIHRSGETRDFRVSPESWVPLQINLEAFDPTVLRTIMIGDLVQWQSPDGSHAGEGRVRGYGMHTLTPYISIEPATVTAWPAAEEEPPMTRPRPCP